MSLDANLLSPNWVFSAYKSKWFAEKLKKYQQQDSDDTEADSDKDYLQLLAESKFKNAANNFIYHQAENESLSLIEAIELDNLDLVLSILSNIPLSYCDTEGEALAACVALNKRSYFNLLLLHPDVKINQTYKASRSDTEVAEFFGDYDHYDYYSPHMWLIESQYDQFLNYFDIDWQHLIRNYSEPLMALLYEKKDFLAMNRLVSLGGEIDPICNANEERLSYLALQDWKDDDPTSQAGLLWLKRFISFLDYDSWDCDLLTDLLRCGNKEVEDLFSLSIIEQYKEELDEKVEENDDLSNEVEKLNDLIFLPNLFPNRQNKQSVSIFDDLIRLEIAEFDSAVSDLQIVVNDSSIEFAIYTHNRTFPKLIKAIPLSTLSDLEDNFKNFDRFANLTNFQIQGFILKHPEKILIALNVLAEENDLSLFTYICHTAISSHWQHEIVCQIFSKGGISGEFITTIERNLDQFENILIKLNDSNLLENPFSNTEKGYAQEWRMEGKNKKPIILVHTETSQNELIIVFKTKIDDIPREFTFDSRHYGRNSKSIETFIIKSLTKFLFSEPIAIPCQTCGYIGFRHDFAYECECMDCINS